MPAAFGAANAARPKSACAPSSAAEAAPVVATNSRRLNPLFRMRDPSGCVGCVGRTPPVSVCSRFFPGEHGADAVDDEETAEEQADEVAFGEAVVEVLVDVEPG